MASVKITLCFLLLGTAVKAQTFAEWFDQKNTRKKYLQEQVAALQAYESVLKNGYNLAHNGLRSITNSGKAELNLHSSYYNSLNAVSPAVKNNLQIKEVLTWQQDILALYQDLNGNAFTQQVATAVLNDCDKQLAELQNIVSDNKTQMSDAERLKAIDRVHTAMSGNYRFSVHFCQQVKILAIQNSRESNDATTLKQAYGNH